MYNQHVNHSYYGVNHDLLTETSNQAQEQSFANANNAYACVPPTAYHAHQMLASPSLEEQDEHVWYNQENTYYQQQQPPQLGQTFNALSCTFGHNDLTSPQELVLFNLLQDQQQQHIYCQDNQLTRHDEQDSPLKEWVLVNANQVDIPVINHSNGLLPLSPMSMSSADNFDSSSIMDGGASLSHPMYVQTNPNLSSHLPPASSVAATQRRYYHHHLVFSNSHSDMFLSEAIASKSMQPQQEIAQMQYQQQQQQEQVYQISEIKQEAYSTFDKQQQQQQQQQPKHPRKTTRRRASRSQLQCATCFKTFSRPYNLKSHQRTHTKERPFQCLYPECGWTFARPHDLKRHELLHSGVKPFACVCGKRFARSDAYKRHQSVNINCAISTMPQQRRRRPKSNITTENTAL